MVVRSLFSSGITISLPAPPIMAAVGLSTIPQAKREVTHLIMLLEILRDFVDHADNTVTDEAIDNILNST